jgi:hypothetical protein
VWRNGRILAKLDATSPNRLIVGEELDAENYDALEIRGSELLGLGNGLLFPREEFDNGGE